MENVESHACCTQQELHKPSNDLHLCCGRRSRRRVLEIVACVLRPVFFRWSWLKSCCHSWTAPLLTRASLCLHRRDQGDISSTWCGSLAQSDCHCEHLEWQPGTVRQHYEGSCQVQG